MAMSEEQKLAVTNLIRETIVPEINQSTDAKFNFLNQSINQVAEKVKQPEEKIEELRKMKRGSFIDKLKEARDSKPKEWSGGDKSYSFPRLSRCIKNWGSVLNPNFDKIMDVAETT
eukprot:2452813-Karenia_brevis.AAC.1